MSPSIYDINAAKTHSMVIAPSNNVSCAVRRTLRRNSLINYTARHRLRRTVIIEH